MSHTHGGRVLRADIQGLRAIAVAMVVVYHLFPHVLPGGFVGVDVFFAISGFLITSHLLTRVPRGLGDLFGFWARRIRRLLPAALLVLVVGLVAIRLLAPETQWQSNATDARAAGLYVVNWTLASRAVDYLAEGQDPSVFQHYWSLSVEEQFYLVWPLLIGVVALIARWRRLNGRTALALALTALVASSFTYSVLRTASDPSAAYFITPARLWELGLGGLLALAVHRLPDQRPALGPLARLFFGWVGLGMIAAAGLTFSSETTFPGWRAALPVVGTLHVILCASRPGDRLTPARLLALRPFQWLGDISYSVYLWHWPLLVLVPYATGHALTLREKLGVLAATLVVSALSERYVEQPFRTSSAGLRPVRTYLVGAVAMAAVVGLASAQLIEIQRTDDQARAELAVAVAKGGSCFGAAALDPGQHCKPVAFKDVVPRPALAAQDLSEAYPAVGGKQCWSSTPVFPDLPCTFGDGQSSTTVALFGNSHAGHWLPALQVAAERQDFRIETHLASRCASADLMQQLPTEDNSEGCLSWVHRVTDELIEEHPALVVMSNKISVPALDPPGGDTHAAYAVGYRKVLERFADADVPVLVIHDTPAAGFPIPECVADHGADYAACNGRRSDWVPDDPAPAEAEDIGDPDLHTVDLNDHICGPQTCTAVTGGVITYFDGSHLGATFAHTLGPYLAPVVRKALQ